MMNLTFRPAVAADARRLSKLVDMAYAPVVRRLYGDSPRGRWVHYEEEKVLQYLDREGEGVRVGEWQGHTLTFCVCRAYGHFGWFHSLAVHPDYQRRGLGRQAVADAEAYLWRQGVQRIHLMTWPEATQNLGFYQALGYAAAGISLFAYRRTDSPLPDAPPQMTAHTFARLDARAQDAALAAIDALGQDVGAGATYAPWVAWTQRQQQGDTLLVWRQERLLGMALTYWRRQANWLEGKALLISPAATAAEQAGVLEAARAWAAAKGRGSLGFPIDLMDARAMALLHRYGFRLFGDSMITLARGADAAPHGIHLVRFGG